MAVEFFRHLDHGAAASGKGGDGPLKLRLMGKFHGTMAPTMLQRLGNHVLGTEEILDVHTAALWLHPGLEVLEGVFHTVDHTEDFGKQGSWRAAAR